MPLSTPPAARLKDEHMTQDANNSLAWQQPEHLLFGQPPALTEADFGPVVRINPGESSFHSAVVQHDDLLCGVMQVLHVVYGCMNLRELVLRPHLAELPADVAEAIAERVADLARQQVAGASMFNALDHEVIAANGFRYRSESVWWTGLDICLQVCTSFGLAERGILVPYSAQGLSKKWPVVQSSLAAIRTPGVFSEGGTAVREVIVSEAAHVALKRPPPAGAAERMKLGAIARLVAPPDNGLARLEAAASGQGKKLAQALWASEYYVSFNKLSELVWGEKAATDEAISKALQRLKGDWTREGIFDYTIKIETASGESRAILIRPAGQI